MNQHGLSPTLIWAMLLEFIGILFIHTLGKRWVLSKPQQGNTEELLLSMAKAPWEVVPVPSQKFPTGPRVDISLPTMVASPVDSQRGRRNCCQKVIPPSRTGVGCTSPQFWVRELLISSGDGNENHTEEAVPAGSRED